MTGPLLLAALVSFWAAPDAAAASIAEAMAVRSGRVIGAAQACQAGEARLAALGRVVNAQIREAATSPDELANAEEAREEAIRFGSRRVKRSRANLCFQAEAALEALERACITERRANCALL